MIYLGIDPGAKGAVGSIIESVAGGCSRLVVDLPGSRYELIAMMNGAAGPRGAESQCFAALERPGYGPPMGKSAAVKLRESYERCAMALVAAGIPFEEVSPQTWKKEIFKGAEILKGKEGKARARARAAELFPSLADQVARVKDDGRAEALLLAEYARRLRA